MDMDKNNHFLIDLVFKARFSVKIPPFDDLVNRIFLTVKSLYFLLKV